MALKPKNAWIRYSDVLRDFFAKELAILPSFYLEAFYFQREKKSPEVSLGAFLDGGSCCYIPFVATSFATSWVFFDISAPKVVPSIFFL